jgi:hypothetical protein
MSSVRAGIAGTRAEIIGICAGIIRICVESAAVRATAGTRARARTGHIPLARAAGSGTVLAGDVCGADASFIENNIYTVL